MKITDVESANFEITLDKIDGTLRDLSFNGLPISDILPSCFEASYQVDCSGKHEVVLKCYGTANFKYMD